MQARGAGSRLLITFLIFPTKTYLAVNDTYVKQTGGEVTKEGSLPKSLDHRLRLLTTVT
jgi:hypothetical protein